MYLGNSNLRGAGEIVDYTDEQIDEIIKCKTDIIYFAENYFKIVHMDKGEHIIQLYDFQKSILKSFVENDSEKRHRCLLSSRQIGKTTISTLYMLWFALFNEDKNIAILANKEETAKDVLAKIKLAYQALPIWMQHGIKDGGWSKKSIELENGMAIMAASTASSAIRGKAIALLFLDEFAFVPSSIADDFMASVYPTISSSKTSKIIIVSTPNGMNHFYHIYRNSVNGTNNFKPIKINWWEVPGRDEEWKNSMIKDVGQLRWNQEFAAKFLGSSKTLIDSDLLERMGETAKEPISYSMGDLLEVFEKPQPETNYIIGVDSAKGIGGDYSAIQVLKINSEFEVEQVAVYRNNVIAPYEFAQVCISVSEYYNGANLMVENNDVGAQVADVIWYEYEYDKVLNCDKSGIGVRSTRKSKLTANMLLKRYLEEGWLKLSHQRTIYELSTYEEIRPDVFQAPRTEHDDCITSLLWALYFFTTEFFDDKDYSRKIVNDQFRVDGQIEQDAPIMITDSEADRDEYGFDWGGLDGNDYFTH